MTASALYRGLVVHARRAPRLHRLSCRIFQLLLDLDELESLDHGLRWFSVGRFNLVSFHPRDHLEGGETPLRRQVEALIARAGLDLQGGAIRVLCMPRVLGHAFNPLTLFFCHRPDGGLAAMLYQVDNTFGERHVYVLPVDPAQAHDPRIEQACEKRFFVSPLMPMTLAYRFVVQRPAAASAVLIEARDADGPVLVATVEARREPLSDRALLRAWAGAPLLSLRVLTSIHWEALRVWLKGVGLHRREPAPGMGVTLVRARWPQPLEADSSLSAPSLRSQL
jgi:DUF1365 family protein